MENPNLRFPYRADINKTGFGYNSPFIDEKTCVLWDNSLKYFRLHVEGSSYSHDGRDYFIATFPYANQQDLDEMLILLGINSWKYISPSGSKHSSMPCNLFKHDVLIGIESRYIYIQVGGDGYSVGIYEYRTCVDIERHLDGINERLSENNDLGVEL